MREDPERQGREDALGPAGPALQASPGKQTQVQRLAADPQAPTGTAGASSAALGGQRAGDWNMSPELMSAMGLGSQAPSVAERLQELQGKAPTQVANQISDPPFGWMSAYEVVFSETEIQLKVKAKLEPQAGVSKDDLLDVGLRATDAFRSYYDSKFIFTDNANGKQLLLRCLVAFVDSGEHYAIKVHPGGDDNTGGNRRKWFVGWTGVVYAHELGHQLGLKDEYIDAQAPDRATAQSPGVHTDNSLLGNYTTEGKEKAEVKLRHAQTIAGHVGGASGRAFTVSKK